MGGMEGLEMYGAVQASNIPLPPTCSSLPVFFFALIIESKGTDVFDRKPPHESSSHKITCHNTVPRSNRSESCWETSEEGFHASATPRKLSRARHLRPDIFLLSSCLCSHLFFGNGLLTSDFSQGQRLRLHQAYPSLAYLQLVGSIEGFQRHKRIHRQLLPPPPALSSLPCLRTLRSWKKHGGSYSAFISAQ